MALPADPTLTWRPLTPDDAALIEPLVSAIGAQDGAAETYTVDDLTDELDAPWLDLDRDSRVVVDGSGAAVAFGFVELRPGDVTLLRARCSGGVLPAARGRGIGRQLLAWQLDRARALAAARRSRPVDVVPPPADDVPRPTDDVPAVALVEVEEGAEASARLAARLGLTVTRWFTVMRRPLDGALPEVDLPAGLRLVPWSAERDDEVRLAHNEAFADHWGFQPWSGETWARWESGHRNFRPDWSFLVADGTQVAGYALSAAYEQDWPALGYPEGWTGKLGVRRPWRGRGLARALLAASMRAFADGGMRSAGLDVDSENLSGAVALYQGLGYRPAHRRATWSTPI